MSDIDMVSNRGIIGYTVKKRMFSGDYSGLMGSIRLS